MRLLVPSLVAEGRLSPNSEAARVYGLKGIKRLRLKKVAAEVKRLKDLSAAEYGPGRWLQRNVGDVP
jgi:hypothetical protein